MVLGDAKGGDLACDVVMKTKAESVMKLPEQSHKLDLPRDGRPPRGSL